jgi:plastocyanin domain-containing protein
MTLDKLLMTIGGAGLIGLIYWFFFGGKKEKGAMHGHHE